MDINYCLMVLLFIFETINGTGCVDPCKNHILVNDTTRLTTYIKSAKETAFCDNFDFDWYRFDASITGAMPTECPTDDSNCGSDMQVWMNDTLPTEADGTVQKEFCVKDYSGCCGMENQLNVKNCTTFFVYHLAPSPVQCFRYCVQDTRANISNTSCGNFTGVQPCERGTHCDVENGKLICKSNREDSKSVTSKMNVKIAASVSGTFVFIVSIFITICCVRKRRRKEPAKQLIKPDIQNVQLEEMSAGVESGSDCTGPICVSNVSPDS